MLLFLVAKPALAWMAVTLSIGSWGIYLPDIPSTVNRRVMLNEVAIYYPKRKLVLCVAKGKTICPFFICWPVFNKVIC